jgi:DNA-binding transcriptional regulator GbsR (MarR family)
MPDTTDTLSPVAEKFILHWGEMGTRWGVNRTVAQVHALLYLSPSPLTAEQIAGALVVARSNVSTSLRELQGWGIVKVVHMRGDRRDHFESMKDVWEMFSVILEERKRREIDPTVELLRACMAEAGKSRAAGDYTRERLRDMLGFFETGTSLYQELRRLPLSILRGAARWKGRLAKLLEAGISK